MTLFGPIADLFAPGRRHLAEEQRRQALTREDPGDADPARGPVDLTSGRVTIRLPGGSPARGGEQEATGGDEVPPEAAGGDEGVPGPAES
ncbi:MULTISPECIES: DUF6191 domain-containing protein [unclassified Streptomyces]|uniref:DUF6191 domain-containing protein n=1 Tax=unclassified Streptomyces TaxID=2593676 RepID=UPI00166182D1|nr:MULTISPECIES: DUF6191 domain-containing protein [unclassified Streptomyces]MBD0710586.1 hypothetical protein [Streptomyces sp. CBMA291]MBD0715433.1 hypothetical protein [Streptomyces sp. CBMA370]